MFHRPRLKWARLVPGQPRKSDHSTTTVTRKYDTYMAAVAPPTMAAALLVKMNTGARPSTATRMDAAQGAPSLLVRVQTFEKGSWLSRAMPKIWRVAPANIVLVANRRPSATAAKKSLATQPGRCSPMASSVGEPDSMLWMGSPSDVVNPTKNSSPQAPAKRNAPMMPRGALREASLVSSPRVPPFSKVYITQ